MNVNPWRSEARHPVRELIEATAAYALAGQRVSQAMLDLAPLKPPIAERIVRRHSTPPPTASEPPGPSSKLDS